MLIPLCSMESIIMFTIWLETFTSTTFYWSSSPSPLPLFAATVLRGKKIMFNYLFFLLPTIWNVAWILLLNVTYNLTNETKAKRLGQGIILSRHARVYLAIGELLSFYLVKRISMWWNTHLDRRMKCNLEHRIHYAPPIFKGCS